MPPARRFSNSRALARPRRRGPSPALKKAQAALQKSRASLRKARATSTGKGGALMSTACTAGGGAIAGASQAMFPAIGPVDTRVLLGVGAVAAGAFMIKGKPGSAMICAGGGILACWVADVVEGMIAGDDTAEEAA